MQTYYWYANCPMCNGQGRLIITEDITHKRLYLHCDECEMGWRNPQNIDTVEEGFLTLTEEFDTNNPTYQTICEYGWKDYARYHFEA